MSEYERERKVDPYDGRNCSVAGGARGTHCFDRVGLFRLDLSYQDPIRVLGGGVGAHDRLTRSIACRCKIYPKIKLVIPFE